MLSRLPSNLRPAITAGLRSIGTHSQLPLNEPLTDFTDPSVNEKLKQALADVNATCEDIPIVIGGQEFRNDDVQYQESPYNHANKLAKFYHADSGLIEKAIENSLIAKEKWDNLSYDARSRVIMKAASLLATKYRYEALARCMIGQAKTCIQADIDAISELVDFLKFNVEYGKTIMAGPPLHNTDNIINSVRMRSLEGFVAAVTPFNFSAIGGNLATAPALMGNAVLWKPSTTAISSNYHFFKILQESGMPDGVIQFVPSSGPTFGGAITSSQHLAGITFTGSSATFNTIWRMVGDNIGTYRTYPKLVGETGGKNYHFVHEDTDIDSVVNGTIRSAFEYSGQKCSACSRIYVPDTRWVEFKEKLAAEMENVTLGSAEDRSTFLSAVIDRKSFDNIKSYIDHAIESPDYEILHGGKCDDSVGYFVDPTVIVTSDPRGKLISEEIFGPVLTVYVYSADKVDETLELIDSTSPYALTGAIFAPDRGFIEHATNKLKNSAGNFYVNDKSTGSVVAQQPFGGARASGTNDKAGMATYMQRWVSPMSIKESLIPLPHWKYPYMSK